MVAQQSQGVGHIPAHRNHQGTGDVGLVDDLLHAHHAGQKVGKALVVVAAVLKLQAVLGVYHAAAQVASTRATFMPRWARVRIRFMDR